LPLRRMAVRTVDHLEGAGCAGKLTASLNIAIAQDGGTHGGSPGRSGLPTSPLPLQPSFGYSGHFSRNLRRFSFLLLIRNRCSLKVQERKIYCFILLFDQSRLLP
jgi:hypothetical protein